MPPKDTAREATPPGSFRAMKPRCGPPLDYSFKEIVNMEDLQYEEPVAGVPKNPPKPRIVDEGDEAPEAPEPPPRPNAVYNATSLRLASNYLENLTGFEEALDNLLDDPQEMDWLDLSCNKLTCVEEVLTKYKNIKVLYLHGNNITRLSEIKKLAALPNLSKLTLHGNPVVELKDYRLYVAAHVPSLKSLDFGTITKVDRDRVMVWARANVRPDDDL